MKISNSKKQLAKIISENGGWRGCGDYAAQDKYDGDFRCYVSFYYEKPIKEAGESAWGSDGFTGYDDSIPCISVLPNWHQTILSRDEYFRLYPAQDADGWIEWKGGECPVEEGVLVDIKLRDGEVAGKLPANKLVKGRNPDASCAFWVHGGGPADIIAYRLHKPDAKVAAGLERITIDPEPTIERLAAEYRNRKDYAERKQQEADAAKAEAEVKLAELVAAGKAVGLVVSVGAPAPELVITDWRDLREGDVIRCVGDAWDDDFEGSEAVVSGIESHDYKYEHRIRACIGEESDWGADFHFIRRPAKEADNA